MSRTLRIALAGALTLPLVAAYAGGWATITVENLPESLRAGTPSNITFSIRQHGHNLLADLEPTLVAKSGKHEVQARGVATNKPGFYTATLTPPAAGDWTLTIRSGFGKSNVTLLPIAALADNVRPVAFNAPERGRHLFVAKGCAACHEHARVKDSGAYDVGPDLTTPRLQPQYLRNFLADPAIKKDWTTGARMPNLALKPAEIDALVAFLNQQSAGATAAR